MYIIYKYTTSTLQSNLLAETKLNGKTNKGKNSMNARRNWIFGLLAAVMLFAVVFASFPAKASDGTWSVNVVHGINGRALGLSKELPVDITVY